MRRLLAFLFSFGLFFLLFISCVSVCCKGEPLEEDFSFSLKKSLEKLRTDSCFEEIISELEKLRYTSPLEFETLSSFYTQAVEGLMEQRDQSITQGQYAQALDKGETLTVLGFSVQPSQEELLLKYLAQLSAISSVKALAVAYRYREVSEGVWKAYYQKYAELFPQKVDSQMWLKGTLTLVVDQGVRMQNGIGVPTKVLGSAFIIDKQGYALTNYHVISSQVDKSYKGYSKLYARLPKGKGERLKADVIGYCKDLDIALIKVYFPVEYCFNLWKDTQDLMRVGQSVYVLGSPLGLEQTLTSGILSAHNRTLLELGDVFQLDAAVNQGNSGGPVVNNQGDVLGMVFAGILGYEGLNFAIPVGWLRLILPFLYDKGPVRQAWLGLAVSESSHALEVMHVVHGQSCEKLLKKGDKLLSLNGKKLSTLRDYQKAVLTSHSLMCLEWQRGDEIFQALVKPKDRPENPLEKILSKSLSVDFLSLLLGLELHEGKKNLFSQNYRVGRVFANFLGDELSINTGDHLQVYTLKLDKNKEFVDLSFLICRQIAGFLKVPIGLRLPLSSPCFI